MLKKKIEISKDFLFAFLKAVSKQKEREKKTQNSYFDKRWIEKKYRMNRIEIAF